MGFESGDPLRPSKIHVPRRGAVSRDPLVFDTRRQAWRLHLTEHPLARDPNHPPGDPPRQQAAASCNLLELYDRMAICFAYYQMEFVVPLGTTNCIVMPYQLIEPRPGWKLRNLTQGKEHVVKSVEFLKSDPPLFSGLVWLKGAAPDVGDELEWVDAEGILDRQPKIIQLMPEGKFGSILRVETERGDLGGPKTVPFLPAVTYRFLTQMPGSVGSRPFQPAKENKPRIRMSVRDPSDPREYIEVWGQKTDNLISLTSHAMSEPMADRMMLWVQNFLQSYSGVLKYLGVSEMVPWQAKPLESDGRLTTTLYSRSVEYYFRLEELSVRRLPAIRQFNLRQRVVKTEEGWLDPGELSEVPEDRWEATHDTSGNYEYSTSVSIGDDYAG